MAGPPTQVLQARLLSEFAVPPRRASDGAAGYDLTAAHAAVVPARGRVLVHTDVAIRVPDGTYGRVAPRSGLAVKHAIAVGAGVIDGDYTGEVGVVLFNHGDDDFEVSRGMRIAQLLLERIEVPDVHVVDQLAATARADGGFGSTGGV